MTVGSCPDCGHVWRRHPGRLLDLTACVECVYEEDHDLRDETAMCARVSPDLEQVPAGRSLVARYERRRLRGDRVSVEDRSGARLLLRPPAGARKSVDHLLAQVHEDLKRMPITQFREKYRALVK